MSNYASPTTINASEGMISLIQYVNQVTSNWFSNMLILGIWVIILMGFYKAMNDVKGAFAVAGYTTFVISLLFWIGGWITSTTFGIVIAVAIISTIPLFIDN